MDHPYLYCLINDNGYVGTFLSIDDCNVVRNHYFDKKFVMLTFKQNKPLENCKIWVIVLKCNVPFLVTTDKNEAEAALLKLQSVDQTFEDPIKYWQNYIGIPKRIKNELDAKPISAEELKQIHEKLGMPAEPEIYYDINDALIKDELSKDELSKDEYTI